jgi:serine/threonine protein kinase
MIGKTLGHYRIIEKLGSGGMGVVYKARDLHLDRFVALKVLPPEMVVDSERKRRFTQEAKAASALNHPNIVIIHDITADQGVDFIAMEYVAGKTLEQLIGRHSLRLNDVLKYGVQIADALAKAHAVGIVHRDLKPANVMINEDGAVKVLDFGLAKLTEHVQGGEFATTASDEPVTDKGTVIGTVAYMSPEQAEGKPLDPRSDIFSFGSVLYEMVTGRRAFKGDNKISTLAAILHQEPSPVSEVSGETPQELERIITRCLKKDPARRFQAMPDLKVALKELKEESDSGKLVSQAGEDIRKPRFSKWIVPSALAAGVVIVAAVLSLIWNLTGVGRAPSPPIQSTQKQITLFGNARSPALSPDGSFVTYTVGSYSSNIHRLMLQDLSSGQAVEIYRASDISGPTWSPDGSQILVVDQKHSPGDVVLVPRLGGTARIVAQGSDPCWSPDGTQIATTEGGFIRFVDISSGASKQIALSGFGGFDKGLFYMRDWARVSNLLLVETSGSNDYALWTMRRDGSQQHKLVEEKNDFWSAHWSPAGDAVYYSVKTNEGAGEIARISVDLKSGLATDKPSIVLGDLSNEEPRFTGSHFTISGNGTRMAYERYQYLANLWQVQLMDDEKDRKLETRKLTTGTSRNISASISPDGKWVAYSIYWMGKLNIYKVPIDGGTATQLTFLNPGSALFNPLAPVWSPDSKRIAFLSGESFRGRVWIIDADGGRPQVLLDADSFSPVWSPDSKRIAFVSGDIGRWKVWLVDADGSRQRQLAKTQPGLGMLQTLSWSPGRSILYAGLNGRLLILDPETEEEKALVKDDSFYGTGGRTLMFTTLKYSPDGTRVAVNTPFSGIWIVSMKDGAAKLVTKEFADLLGWSPDGSSVYADIGNQIMAFLVTGGNPRLLFSIPNAANTRISPDGHRVVYSISESTSDIWLVENFDPTRKK